MEFIFNNPEKTMNMSHEYDLTVRLISFLASTGYCTGYFLDTSYEFAIKNKKKDDQSALMGAMRAADPIELTKRLKSTLAEGSLQERRAAVSMVASVLEDDAIPMLQEHLQREKSKSLVQQIEGHLQFLSSLNEETVAEADRPDTPHYIGMGGIVVPIPPVVPAPETPPVSEEAREALDAYARRCTEEGDLSDIYYGKIIPHNDEQRHDLVEKTVAIMEGRSTHDAAKTDIFQKTVNFIRDSDFINLHKVGRFHISHYKNLCEKPLWSLYYSEDIHKVAWRALTPPYDIRTLVNMYEDASRETALRGFSEMETYLTDAQIWPYLAENMGGFDIAFGLTPSDKKYPPARSWAMRELRRFPLLPQRYFAPIFEVAHSGLKDEQPDARDLLAPYPEVDDHISGLLGASKSALRLAATHWLVERNSRHKAPDLLQALKKEKGDIVRAEILGALLSLGEDIAAYQSRDTLLTEAQKGCAKKRKRPDWLRLDVLPPLHWTDGTTVDPVILQWWCILADQLKRPNGHPLLTYYLQLLAPESQATLAAFVLDSFIDEDLRRAKECESASAHRGLLALAILMDGAILAQKVQSYIRNNSDRLSQCWALMHCLQGNGSDPALQELLGLARGHKRWGIWNTAQNLVDKISEIRGLSVQDLEDMTVPTAGLDNTGSLSLPIGEHIYTARLGPDLKLGLLNPAGKPVRSLPNSDEAATAKALLAQARKNLKQVVSAQTGRLYDALCCERRWSIKDWRELLLHHPILGQAVQRLVWLSHDANGDILASFRPLDDLSLTDAADATVSLDDAQAVSLAHHARLPPETCAQWRDHLADYDVTPLLQQFGPAAGDLEALPASATELTDRQGHMIDSQVLHRVAQKRGYIRSRSEEAGSVFSYSKEFSTVDYVARLNFSGAFLGDINQLVALLSMSFVAHGDAENFDAETVPLTMLPRALVSEVWSDFHAIADAGTGFDPEWQSKGLI
jgi:hypothetical protein